MNRFIAHIALVIFLFAGFGTVAQEKVAYQIQGKNILAIIKVDQPKPTLDSIVQSFGFVKFDSITYQQSRQSWKVKDLTDTRLILVFNKNASTKEMPPSFVVNDAEVVHVVPDPFAVFGVNNFKKRGVFTKGGETVFTLDDFNDAENVYLSGSFNEWSTLKTPMKRTANGWEARLDLPAGKHLYKFIVDGRWMEDIGYR